MCRTDVPLLEFPNVVRALIFEVFSTNRARLGKAIVGIILASPSSRGNSCLDGLASELSQTPHLKGLSQRFRFLEGLR